METMPALEFPSPVIVYDLPDPLSPITNSDTLNPAR